MAWTAPMTALAGVAFTAAQFNTHVRDNLLATEIGLATPSDGSFHMANQDDNELSFLTQNVATAAATVSTTSDPYVNLGGSTPALTLTTGRLAMVAIYSWTRHTVQNGSCWLGLTVSGATSFTVDCLLLGTPEASQLRMGASIITVVLNPGSNTFTVVYGETGGGTAEFANRTLSVIAL